MDHSSRRLLSCLSGLTMLCAVAASSHASASADIALSIAESPNPAMTDSTVLYSVTVTNLGPDDATEVTITNALPQQVKYIACDAGTNGACSSPAIGVVTATFPLLASGASETLSITGEVRCAAPNRALLADTAVAGAAEDDPLGTNNRASITTTNRVLSHKSSCLDTITFIDTLVDYIICGDLDNLGIFECAKEKGERTTITAKISMQGVDLSQINENTQFDLSLGEFSINYSLLNDDHYTTNKTSATFVEYDTNDSGRSVPSQTVHLKWTRKLLTASVTTKARENSDIGLLPVVADRYYGTNAPIANAISASIDFGVVTQSFDAVFYTGKTASKLLVGPRHTGDFNLFGVQIKGAGSE